MSIKINLAEIKATLPDNVTLVAVSKTKPNKAIEEAYDAGQREFGENRVQELVAKAESLPKDIEWHLIGHLQKNKVKYIAPFVSLIHGVDSIETLKEINKQGKKNNRVINCLLQAKIATEESKFGMSFGEIERILKGDAIKTMQNLNIVGLMGMASFTDVHEQIVEEFNSLKTFFDSTRLSTLSMGMSGDYKIAIEQGSTMVRVGSAIFGSRL
ncbi:YggS family pyridoxal phosphate-dependent enzyme [Flavicella marina]|uniref:YggS family pyridoxal phosphate-dependent enzyme n=1 Tax=Flavicella marina TaxID=1475951 RepID=UPI0012659D9B|nr:YggS family pyridoxal phosphate-dependent enzyme [Flavicella marina]